jgi:transcriptional regulator with XRE-family HTH domain
MDWYSMSDPAIMAELGKRIKEYRIRKNFTQNELAEKTGISVLSVQNLEKGFSVSLSTLIPLLRQLNLMRNLDLLIPEPPVSPVNLLKLKGKTRIRVKKSGKSQIF